MVGLIRILLNCKLRSILRLLNRWWKRLPEKDKIRIITKMKKNSKIIVVSGIVTVGSFATVYNQHLEVSQITGRKRFMAISSDDLNYILGEDAYKELLEDESATFNDHPKYKLITGIIDTIVSKNKDKYFGLDREWTLLIVNDDDVVNAACLPTGHVIVFTGLVNFVENPHQLAAIIAHEMSHILLEHGRESLSRASILSVMLSVFSFILWTFVPGDFTALWSTWLKNRISKIFVELPYSRMMESEADVLGLTLLARACFKVEEAKRFWEIMDVFEKQNTVYVPDWLSTHPSSILRAHLLERYMSEARKISEDCGCFKDSFTISNIVRRLSSLKML